MIASACITIYSYYSYFNIICSQPTDLAYHLNRNSSACVTSTPESFHGGYLILGNIIDPEMGRDKGQRTARGLGKPGPGRMMQVICTRTRTYYGVCTLNTLESLTGNSRRPQ